METKKCEKCSQNMRLQKGGVSRKGQSYDSFWTCDRTCGNTAKYEEPEKVVQMEDWGTGQEAPPEFQPLVETTRAGEVVIEDGPMYPGPKKTGEAIIIEKLEAIDKRLTDMGKWLVENVK